MFDRRTNRTPIERWGLIGFDWFLVRFRSIDYAGLKLQATWGRLLYNSFSRSKSAILGITIPGIKMGSRKHYLSLE